MPYTNATGTAAVVASVPPQAGSPHAYLINTSGQVAYVGGQYVTSISGLPLYPNNRLDLSNMPGTVYAVAGLSAVAPSGTTSSVTALGGSVLTLVTNPGYVIGASLVLDAGTPRQEIATVAGTATGGTGLTVSSALTFVHASGIAISAITPYVTTVQAVRGAT